MGPGGVFLKTGLVARPVGEPHHRNVSMKTISSILLVSALLGLTACGTSRSSAPSPFDGTAGRGSTAEDPVRIDVQNINFNDVTVWAVRPSGQRTRLGQVTGKTDETFRIQWNLAVPIYFAIDVTGGRGCRTGQVSVERNARVWVIVPSNVGSQPCRAGRR
jgi:hypothetical protein